MNMKEVFKERDLKQDESFIDMLKLIRELSIPKEFGIETINDDSLLVNEFVKELPELVRHYRLLEMTMNGMSKDELHPNHIVGLLSGLLGNIQTIVSIDKYRTIIEDNNNKKLMNK